MLLCRYVDILTKIILYTYIIIVIGVAMILPYKNKAFDEAKPLRHIDLKLDGFVWHLKPPLSEEVSLNIDFL